MNNSQSNPVLPVRKAAVDVLLSIHRDQGTLSTLLPNAIASVEVRDAGLLQELCYGVCRWHHALTAQLDVLLSKPLRRKDLDVRLLMLLGIYQLRYMRIAPHAALNETVSIAGKLGKPWARGLVNAVLRNYQRQQLPDTQPLHGLEAQHSHPEWMILQLQKDWPQHWQQIIAAANAKPPLVLRRNICRGDVDSYLQLLQEAEIKAQAVTGVTTAIRLELPISVEKLPGFFDGEVSVQDAAAQLAGQFAKPLLQAVDESSESPGGHCRVLDACAAPGGKTGHLLECLAASGKPAQVVALDNHPLRLERVRDNLSRLSLQDQCEIVEADATDIKPWWDEKPFDLVLLDAPCSGSGVIRRHPDIKLLRKEADLATLADSQKQLLDSLWPLLKPGGHLLYVTCSVFRQENQIQVGDFLQRTENAKEQALPVIDAIEERQLVDEPGPGLQILPGENDMDGFFYCLLEKSL